MNRLLRTRDAGTPTAFFQITVFSSANYLAELFFFLRGFFLARILGPETFGIWAQMKLALDGCRHGSLGANDAMQREVPYLAGKERRTAAGQIKAAAAGINLALSTVAALLIATIVLLFGDQLSQRARAAWFILAMIFPIRQMLWYARARLRAEKRFNLLSIIMLALAFLTTFLGIVGGFFFGLNGFLLGLAGCHLLVLMVVLLTVCPLRLKHYRLGLSLQLIRTGFPIMASRFLLALFYNVDQIFIWLLLSKTDLGHYSIQTYIVAIVLLFPTVVSAVLYPRIMEAFGKLENPEKLTRYLIPPTLLMGWLACLVLGLMIVLLHLPVKWLLPAYVPSIMPGRVLLLASFFRVIANMPMILHISLHKERRLMRITLVSMAICAAVDGLMITNGFGLTGVAVGTTIGFGVYAHVTIVSASRLLGLTLRRALTFLTLTIMPFVFISLLLSAIYVLMPEQATFDRAELANTLLRCGFFFMPMALLSGAIYLYRNKLSALITSI